MPTLNLCGYPIHRAVGTASFFGIVISIPGTVGYLLARAARGAALGDGGIRERRGAGDDHARLHAHGDARRTRGALADRRRLSQAFGVFLLLVGIADALSRAGLSGLWRAVTFGSLRRRRRWE